MRRRLPFAMAATAIAVCAALVAPTAAGAAPADRDERPSTQDRNDRNDRSDRSDKDRKEQADRERKQRDEVRRARDKAGRDGVDNAFPIDRGSNKPRRQVPPRPPKDGGKTPKPAPASAKALVLYDSTGDWGWLGELYGTAAANLTSHFGTFTAKPVADYKAGEIDAYTGAIYIGSTYDEPIPTAFLDDVLAGSRPVMWIDNNIWELDQRAGTGANSFAATYGFAPWYFDTTPVAEVRYKGASLSRYAANAAGIMSYSRLDASATVLAQAVKADGTTIPWAVRGKNLTYLGENPFAYISENDRYLVASDLLFDLLAPNTATQHRALVRLEDVGPDADPAALRAIGDLLGAQGVPFSFGVYPVYKDPNGVANDGVDTTIRLRDVPEVVSAIKYLQKKGGTMIMHGYTHQFSSVPNPYDGQSGNDFEFFTAHVDATDTVVYDGPVPGDSVAWAKDRIAKSAAEFKAAGLQVPTTFEFPHYAGSADDYAAVGQVFDTRYERSLYFKGTLSKTTVDPTHFMGQFFPYKVKDVYGTTVIPENLGNYEPEPFNQHPARLPAQIVETAVRNQVVRDGVASFFYHPFLGVDGLSQIISGIKAAGYTFVPASAM